MSENSTNIQKLLDVMRQLRNKTSGCPWDVEQTFESIAPYAIEEAYEVADAVARKNMSDLKEELGDLLLQVVFHSQMAQEENLFRFDDVVDGLVNKLISRHPHVFGEETAQSAEEVLAIWQTAKDKERAKKTVKASILDDIPVNFPALMRCQKISKKAAKAGFEWKVTEDVIDKVIEELNEFREEIKSGNFKKQQEELGDVFFTLVQLGRRLDIDCEETMSKANYKFYRRFSGMEHSARSQGRDLNTLSSEEWEILWQEQKKSEKM